MPVSREISEMLAETDEAREAFAALVRNEKDTGPQLQGSLMSGLITGAIPAEHFQASLARRVSGRINTEHERVLCQRFGHELDTDIDPTPDPIARAYLFTVGLVDPSERLTPELET